MTVTNRSERDEVVGEKEEEEGSVRIVRRDGKEYKGVKRRTKHQRRA